MCVAWSTRHWPFIRICNKEGSYAVNLNTFKCTARSRFATVLLRQFTFMTLVQSDRALSTCGASLSQLKHPLSTQCTSSSFLVRMSFFFFYFSAVLFQFTMIFPPMTTTKKIEKMKKSKQLTLHSFLMSSESRPGPSSTK